MPVLTLILCITAIVASFEIVPLVISGIFGINYGATDIGVMHQHMNEVVMLAYWSWIAFDFLVVYAILRTLKTPVWGGFFKTVVVAALLVLTYMCVYPILNVVNLVFMLILRNPPIMYGKEARDRFPQSEELENNARYVRAEYDAFVNTHIAAPCINDTISGFQISVPSNKGCWRTIVLKKQGRFVNGARRSYPHTCKLIEGAQVHNAIFSILDARVNIPAHLGYYKGYLRYHLGVKVPKGGEDGPAFIICGGERYQWRKGRGVLFDDMYSHRVENPTDEARAVLYLDVIRNDIPAWLVPLHHATNVYIETHPVLRRIIRAQHKTSRL
jgi:aspartyl/asparaginyl beta-hydroxylase (cupin superfamily)